MKILFINNTKDFPGSAISLLNLFKGLKAKGVELILAGPKLESALFQEKLMELNVPYITIYNHKNIWPKIRKGSLKDRIISYILWPSKIIRLQFHIIYAKSCIYRIIETYKPDIIHSNSGVIHEGVICAKKRGIPHLIHLREYQDLDFGMCIYPSKSSFERLLRDTYVITITKDILYHFNLQKYPKARVIYNGIYPEEMVAWKWPKEKFFLCCSRINPGKGHDDVIKAFSNFAKQQPDYRLKILGNGPDDYIKYLKQLAVNLGCEEKIEWEGFSDNPYKYMIKAKSLIVASLSEGFGRMTAEASFAGCIVIGRNTGGTREILQNTGGYLFDTNDGMERAMHQVAELNEIKYKEMIVKSQNYSVNNYSNESNVENTYNFYMDVIRKK